ncbi:molybdenum cofactor guanylyltransferase MobA [Phytohalomonas tamaricis]|uniref:molybdenum cofactor guanylyltransferase MobA n=1 Tax=Phytohalomonas tamaricis TaxID=2081032 RepID=UPI000D0B30D7|nr:molybdenum cofactor guanylyltransferase MobA [Phytohalomonas tamaricis]
MPQQVQRDQITGVILAGGQGRRMGGVDKGWVDFEGRPLIEHMLRLLSTQLDNVLINANRSQERYRALGVEVVEDAHAGFQGPLMGIYSAMKASRTPWTLVVPCDTPLLPNTLVTSLSQAVDTQHADIAYACDHDRDHPVIALIRTALVDDLEALLASDERKINRWYARHRQVAVMFDNADMFANINTPEERTHLTGRL